MVRQATGPTPHLPRGADLESFFVEREDSAPLNLERVSDNAYASSLPPTAQNSALSGRTASAELADDAVTRDLGDAHRVIVSGEPGPGGQAQRATFNESSRQIPCHVPCGGAFSQGNPLLPIAA